MDTQERLEALIEEATTDCYNEYEAIIGFLTALGDNLQFPFPARVVGEEVEVTGLEEEGGLIVAECRRKGKMYKVELLRIEFNPEEVAGSEWIEAYRLWLKGS